MDGSQQLSNVSGSTEPTTEASLNNLSTLAETVQRTVSTANSTLTIAESTLTRVETLSKELDDQKKAISAIQGLTILGFIIAVLTVAGVVIASITYWQTSMSQIKEQTALLQSIEDKLDNMQQTPSSSVNGSVPQKSAQ